MAASDSTRIHPPACVSGPLRSARHSRPAPWIRRFVSMPGIDAYWRDSLSASHALGGLFQPGTAVEPAGGGAICGAPGTLPACRVGAVTGGAGEVAAGDAGS